jgi:DNA-binding MarR family transcriptional regulator
MRDNMPLIDLSNSYLYKLHRLSTSFHAVLDQRMRLHTGIGLSQGILLALVSQRQPVSQQEISDFLDITPGAVSRRVESAIENKWLTASGDQKDRRRQLLSITPAGQKVVENAYGCLKEIADSVLEDKNLKTDLSGHIDLMQQKIDAVKHT